MLSEALTSTVNLLMDENLKHAVSVGVPIAASLLAVRVAWSTYKYFVNGESAGFSSGSDYRQFCEDNDIDPDFAEEMEYMTEDEIEELFENSETVEIDYESYSWCQCACGAIFEDDREGFEEHVENCFGA